VIAGDWVCTSTGLLVPEEIHHLATNRIGLDLFAGCGGFSLGMEAGGIDVAGALELDVTAASVYLYNLGHPTACQVGFDSPEREASWEKLIAKQRQRTKGKLVDGPGLGDTGWVGYTRPRSGSWAAVNGGCRGFMIGDARRVSGDQLRDLARVDHFDVVFGGPPCQELSRLNAKACLEDPRNGLLWEFLRIVKELGSECFLIENVPQILTAGEGGLFQALCDRANGDGYDVVAEILDAASYGVPQRRKRALIFGARAGTPATSFQFPMPTHWGRGQRADGESWNMIEKEASLYDGSRFKKSKLAGEDQPTLFEDDGQ